MLMQWSSSYKGFVPLRWATAVTGLGVVTEAIASLIVDMAMVGAGTVE